MTLEGSAAESTPWNRVTLGDGTEAILLPALACINRIREADGRLSCNHGDEQPCDRQGHETIATYEVVKQGDPRWWDAPTSNEAGVQRVVFTPEQQRRADDLEERYDRGDATLVVLTRGDFQRLRRERRWWRGWRNEKGTLVWLAFGICVCVLALTPWWR